MNQGKLEVVKQEMAGVNINILGISKLKWTGMGEFISDDHYIYYCRQESLRQNGRKQRTKEPLDESEREKVGLKLNIQKTKIMASSPITSWEIDGETVETVTDFILGGSKITADGECSHEIKRRLLWKESYDQPR